MRSYILHDSLTCELETCVSTDDSVTSCKFAESLVVYSSISSATVNSQMCYLFICWWQMQVRAAISADCVCLPLMTSSLGSWRHAGMCGRWRAVGRMSQWRSVI